MSGSAHYPDRLPRAVAEVLGMPPFLLAEWWGAMREVGIDVPRRYEGEVGSALHFLLAFAIQHPDDWRGKAVDELKRVQAGGGYETPVLTIAPATPEPLARALDAAVKALRSYQHGNSAPDLAEDIADAGDAALVAAGLPKGTL